MSDDDLFRTLAYKKSPKASRRTTFQDELQAAVSARAQKSKREETHAYSDDFEDDDVLTEILNRRKKKLETFRKGKKQVKVQDFPLSDEEENARPKKVSFLKSRKTSSPVEGRHAEKAVETETTANTSRRALNESSQSTLSSSKSEGGYGHRALSPKPERSPPGQVEPLSPLRGQSESPVDKGHPSEFLSLSQNWRSDSSLSGRFHPENTQSESLSPQLTEGGQRVSFHSTESSEHEKTLTSDPQGPPLAHPRGNVKEKHTTDTVSVEGPPKPKPRQRMLRAASPVMDEDERPAAAEPPPSPTLSSSTSLSQSPTKRAGTSSSSSSGKRGPSRRSPQVVERGATPSPKQSGCSSSAGDGMSAQKSAEDSPFNNGLDESGEVKKDTYSVCFEEETAGRPDIAESRQTDVSHRTDVTRPSSAQTSSSKKSARVSSHTAKAKYLGSLQVLDKQLPDTESKPEAASLRAAVYQEWLRKKQEKFKEELRIKRHEEKQKEEKKREVELTKSQVAKASYEAWKEKKKETITTKVKEKLEALRKQEMEMNEKEEKKDTAKKVFEKWKEEQDKILKEKMRKQTANENKLKQKKEREAQERKEDASAAFTKWSETKKDVIQERMMTERRKEREKKEEEQYEKEERDQLALEMYEKWMRRKEFQQKREKSEKRIQAILQDEPPPPWSPPNKTVPFGK